MASPSLIKKILMIHKERKWLSGIDEDYTSNSKTTSFTEGNPVENAKEKEESKEDFYFLNNDTGVGRDYKELNKEAFLLGRNYERILQLRKHNLISRNKLQEKTKCKSFKSFTSEHKRPDPSIAMSNAELSNKTKEAAQTLNFKLPQIYNQLKAGIVNCKPIEMGRSKSKPRELDRIKLCERNYSNFLKSLKVSLISHH